MIHDVPTNAWDLELEELFLRTGARFTRVEPRRRMRDYVRGLLGPVGRKNSRQLAEHAGHATPHGLQHLLSHSRRGADGLRDGLQAYVAEQLGTPDRVLILDDTGFVKKGTPSAGVQRQYSGTADRTENRQIGVFAAYATTHGHALADRELYLPQSWTEDRERCRAARIPDQRSSPPRATSPAASSVAPWTPHCPSPGSLRMPPTDRTPASGVSWKTRNSLTSSPCPSRSR